MNRVICFVDGFNIYHATDDLDKAPSGAYLNQKQHLKWLDLKALARLFLKPSSEVLTDVYYFSAFATWRPDAYQRHRAYVAALTSSGVHVVLGKFKQRDSKCRRCGAPWITHEEKQSDVNLAIRLLQLAHTDAFDKAFVMSADTDLVPVIRMVKQNFPAKRVEALIPQHRFGSVLEMRQACDQAIRIKESHLEGCLFPPVVQNAAGQVIATRPAKYDPPAPGGPP